GGDGRHRRGQHGGDEDAGQAERQLVHHERRDDVVHVARILAGHARGERERVVADRGDLLLARAELVGKAFGGGLVSRVAGGGERLGGGAALLERLRVAVLERGVFRGGALAHACFLFGVEEQRRLGEQV